MAQSGKSAKRERQRENRARKLEVQAAAEKRRRLWRSVRGFALVLVPVAVVFAVLVLRNGDDGGGSATTATTATTRSATTTITTLAPKAPLPRPEVTIDPARTYTATIETTQGRIVIALDAKGAPVSVNNFVYLARQGYYDGLLINRAAKNFVIQTGSPNNTQSGGPGYSVQSEAPPGPYAVGSVAWAKAGNEPAGTAGSQFFIGTGSNITTLPRDYGYIGTVTEGLAVAEKIMGFAPASGDGPPSPQVQMTKVTIAES